MSTPTYRDSLRLFTPAWLQRTNADKLLWAITLQLDGLADAVVAGVKLRFPGLYTYESLPYIGRERRIRRGRFESSATYAGRLQRWLEDHKTRGGPYALLAQLYAHYAPNNFVIHLLYKSGRRFVMDASGSITVDAVPPAVLQPQWARWTLYYFTDEWPTEADVTPDIARDLTMIPKEWIAAHPIGKLLLMPTGVELWNYHSPARTWNNPSLWNKPPAIKFAI